MSQICLLSGRSDSSRSFSSAVRRMVDSLSSKSRRANAGKFDPGQLVEKELRSVVASISNDRDRKKDPGERYLSMLLHNHAKGVFRRRRKEALLSLLPVLQQKYHQTFCEGKSIFLQRIFLRNELLPEFDYDMFDLGGGLRLGASIWILDHLKRAGKIEAALRLLQNYGHKKSDSLLPPKFFHPCYSNAVVNAMMSAITMRFASPLENDMEPWLAYGNVILKENAEGSEYNPVFQGIMDLLPEETVESVCNEFRDRVWEVCSIFYKGVARYRNESESYNGYSRGTEPCVSGCTGPVADKTIEDTVSCSSVQPDFPVQMKRFMKNFSWYFLADREMLHGVLNDPWEEEMFSGFSLSDPVGMCFALIYLLDHGDDLPWMIRSVSCVMGKACLSLPWGPSRTADGKILELRYEPEVDPLPEGWQRRDFESVDCLSVIPGGQNIGQAVYRMSGCVIPFGVPNPFDEKIAALQDTGLAPFEAGFVSGAAYTMYLSSHQADLPEKTGNEPENAGKLDDAANPCEGASRPEDTGGCLEEEFRLVKKEVKELKKTIAEERHKHSSELRRMEKELERAQQEHRELADLRELVFNGFLDDQTDVADPAEKQDGGEGFKFPYETKKRVVALGGNDSFQKALKEHLPNVRAIAHSSLSVSPDIVRNADVVWIQWRGFRHSRFWQVSNIARQYGIQVRFFIFSNARKCALRVAEDDVSCGL